MSIAAVVLAAGGGRRFSGPLPKLLVSYHGRPLVSFALKAALAAGCDEAAVVTGAVDLTGIVPAEMTVLHNPEWSTGLSSSLAVALRWCEQQGHEAVVLGLGDMPGVPPSAWRAVAESKAEVAVASFGGALRPPVRLAASLFGEVPRSGDVGARELWKRPGALQVPCEGNPIDVDTEEDLEQLERSEA